MKKKAKKEHLNSECTVEEEKQLAVGSELLFFWLSLEVPAITGPGQLRLLQSLASPSLCPQPRNTAKVLFGLSMVAGQGGTILTAALPGARRAQC